VVLERMGGTSQSVTTLDRVLGKEKGLVFEEEILTWMYRDETNLRLFLYLSAEKKSENSNRKLEGKRRRRVKPGASKERPLHNKVSLWAT
jgi:hypothetical protein